MKKINYTQKDISPHMLILVAEVALISASGDIGERSRYTKKWDEVDEELRAITERIHSLATFLDYCRETSGQIRENDLNRDKVLAWALMEILKNIEKPEVLIGMIKLAKIATAKEEQK